MRELGVLPTDAEGLVEGGKRAVRELREAALSCPSRQRSGGIDNMHEVKKLCETAHEPCNVEIRKVRHAAATS